MKAASLRLRLLTGAVVFIFAALAIAAAGLSYLFERHVKTWIDAELESQIGQLIGSLEPDPTGTLTVARPPSDPRYEPPYSGRYWQITLPATGTTIRSRSLWDHTIALPPPPGIGTHSHHHEVQGPKGQTLYVIEQSVELPVRLGRQKVLAAVGLDDADVSAAVWQFATALAPFLLLLAALISAAAWVQVSLGLKPLANVRDRISGIRSGTMTRLGTGLPEEVMPLAHEIDQLLDARDGQIETARARAADLAHGLKTPIQVMIGSIERLKSRGDQDIAGDLETAANLMQRHIDRQLARARVHAGGGEVSARVSAVAEPLVRVVRKTPDGARLAWTVTIPDTLRVRIHPDDLSEAIGGLLENASRHARTRVVLLATEDTNAVTISVSDDGPGIPDDKFDSVLGRGQRLDTTGPGSGLGLAIVADIADAWGGSIAFANSDELFSANLRLPKSKPL